MIEDAHVNGAIEISGSESWVTLDGVFPREGAFATAIPPAVNVSGGAIVELTGSRLGDVTVDAATIRIGASRIGSVSVTHGGIATCAGVGHPNMDAFYGSADILAYENGQVTADDNAACHAGLDAIERDCEGLIAACAAARRAMGTR